MHSLSMEMTAGIEYAGASASTTIATSYEQEISTTTANDMTKDVSATWTIACKGSEGAKGGVGLWQFVVRNGGVEFNDGLVYTGNTVCRYGDLYNVKPACPWNACINGDCSECAKDWMSTVPHY